MTENRPVQTHPADIDARNDPNGTVRSSPADQAPTGPVKETAGQTVEAHDVHPPNDNPSRFPAGGPLPGDLPGCLPSIPPDGGQASLSAYSGVLWEATVALSPPGLLRGCNADGYPLAFLLCHLEVVNGCWIWRPANGQDFPKKRVLGRLRFGHVFLFETAFGPVPDGLVVLRRCHQRRCVAPRCLVAAPKRFEKRLDELPPRTAFFAG